MIIAVFCRMGLAMVASFAMGHVPVHCPGMGTAPDGVSVDRVTVTSYHRAATAIASVSASSHIAVDADIPSAPATAETMPSPTVAITPV